MVALWWPTSPSPQAIAEKNPQGNWQDRTEWHNLVAFTRLAEIVRDYVKKGSKLYVEGKIQTRSWDDKETGAKRYRTEIIVNDISLLSGREEGGSGGYSRGSTASNAPANFDQRAPAGNDEYAQQAEISDDDIPFDVVLQNITNDDLAPSPNQRVWNRR